MRSTVGSSRLAKALGFLTSSPHFWIRSSSSGLFSPNSLANSWTRVDKGDSSWLMPVPRRPRPIGIVGLPVGPCQGQIPRDFAARRRSGLGDGGLHPALGGRGAIGVGIRPVGLDLLL